MLSRIKNSFIKFTSYIAVHYIKALDSHNIFPVKQNTISLICFHIRWKDFNYISLNPKVSTFKHIIISAILHRNQLVCKLFRIKGLPHFNVFSHSLVHIRHTKTINTRNSCNNNNVTSFHKAVSGSKTHLVDFAVYVTILFDIKITSRNVGFRLIVIVI